jgi:hypothetical protein
MIRRGRDLTLFLHRSEMNRYPGDHEGRPYGWGWVLVPDYWWNLLLS